MFSPFCRPWAEPEFRLSRLVRLSSSVRLSGLKVSPAAPLGGSDDLTSLFVTADEDVLFPSATLIRGSPTIVGKSLVNLAAQANQKKLSDPGGGTFR